MIRIIKGVKSKYIWLFFLFIQCVSLERGIKSNLFFSGVNVAAYKMDETPIQFLNEGTVSRVLLDDKIIKNILYTIRKEKSTLPSLVKDTLWNSETIEELTLVVKDIANTANEGKTFFLVVKEEDPLSPYSRIFRTTFYMNRDGNSLQMVFGEINNNINFGTQFNFQDWSNPSFFSITCQKEKNIAFNGKFEKSFEFKKDSLCVDNNQLPQKNLDSKVDAQNNYRWILVSLEAALRISKEIVTKPENGKSVDREKRLGELLRLYKKGLISKDDYELKKAEILGEL